MPHSEFTRRQIVAAMLAGSLAFPRLARSASSLSTPRTLFELIDDPLLRTALYASPQLRAVAIAPDGAVGVNQTWEKGQAKNWFIEIQRISGDLVQAGAGLPDVTLIEQALPVMRWGFSKQGPDGGFPGTGDPFHSTEIFVSDTGRALLLLKQSGAAHADDALKEFLPPLERAANWLADPKNLEPGLAHNAPYTHRRYILASAFGIAGELTGNESLFAAAEKSAMAGLALQTAEGVNPEKGGFDVNYQSAGLLFASRYFTSCQNAALREQLRGMLREGLKWLSARVTDQGDLTTEGSTRVAGQEKLRWGKTKSVNYMELVQTFCHGAKITGTAEYVAVAERIARGHAPIGPDQLV